MPYKQSYSGKTVKKGGSRTPKNVMGGQGKSVKVAPSHKAKKTKRSKFPI